MTKQELLDRFDVLKADVMEFARKSVHGEPHPAIPDNPVETIEHGEESTVGHVHAALDQAKSAAEALQGSDSSDTAAPAATV